MNCDIYLDIDGVLLANDKYAANHIEKFLHYVTDNYQTYWLTTHCHNGDTNWIREYLSPICSNETMELIKRIKPTEKDWDIAKTEAIDFTRPFLWFDDDLYPEEKEALLKQNCLANWVEVDLSKNENQLLDFSNKLPAGVLPTGLTSSP